MSSRGDKIARVQFITDENVDFCSNLVTKPVFSTKLKKSNLKKKQEITSKTKLSSDVSVSDSRVSRLSVQQINESRTSKHVLNSSSKSTRDKSSKSSYSIRSSSHSAELLSSASRRKNARKSQVISQTDKSEFDVQTPKKRRRKLLTTKNDCYSPDDDEREEINLYTPLSSTFNAETPRRSSRRIESTNKTKESITKNSLFLTESPKSKRGMRQSAKILFSKSKRLFDVEPNRSNSDEGSSSEPEELSSKISIPASIIKNKSKKRNQNADLASNSNCTVIQLSTVKSIKLCDQKQLHTPVTVRRKLTKQFAAISKKVDSDEEASSLSDSEASSDEYVPSSSDADSSEKEDTDSSDVDENKPLTLIQGKISKFNHDIVDREKTIDVDFSYKVDADYYFLSKCSREPTSNNQLSALEVSHLEEDEVKNLLRNEYTKHEVLKDSLIPKYRNEFTRWLFYLKENFNLLMYGLGSKIELLERFHSEMLSMHDVLTIHGYFPRLFVKDVVNSLITDILKVNAPKNVNEALPVIKSTLKSRQSPVFIIIHNADRFLSRQRKHQSIISKLASFPNLHMIASIDHINAPLLWGNSMLTALSFIWVNTTTYQPYVNETSFENLIYLTESGSDFVSLSSLRNIFKPLAPRIKKIFQIIAKERLDNANNRHYKGMSYENWYHRAKEELLVNNITIFKVQLTELIDHGIIKISDQQCIPILVKLDVLEKFYKEMYSSEE